MDRGKNREVKYIRDQLIEELKGVYPEDEVRYVVAGLLLHITGIGKTEVIVDPSKKITQKQIERLKDALQQLKSERPLQYITGGVEFYGIQLAVDDRVLIPRPETEELVQWIIDEHAEQDELNILDIGTGSGCIALALKKHFTNCRVFAIDNSPDAVAVSKKNAKNQSLEINFAQADILSSKGIFYGIPFDIIVSNPPYVTESEKSGMRRNVTAYEPHSALFVPDDDPLIYYRAIADFALQQLTPDGAVYVEINEAFGKECLTLFRKKGFRDTRLKKDINGKDRIICASVIKND
jgi:release factor glutamine methyltransferase